jgi:lactate dehydrogenase-like 2-hydroxyacid dehydrogenase
MVEGHKMDLVYHDLHPNEALEAYVRDYGAFLEAHGEPGVTCRRAESLDDLLAAADVVSVHTVLDASTHHLFGARQFAAMKPAAIFVNSSRGPLHDEEALVEHCRTHPDFYAALDVFEAEPRTEPGLADLLNVVMVPHLGSATGWTRQGMAVLAARNALAMLDSLPVWNRPDVLGFLADDAPAAAPSIVNADDLALPFYQDTTEERS